MLKITHEPIEIGTQFSIRNSWRTALANALKKDEELYPFLFKVLEINNDICICESVPDKHSKKRYALAVSTMIIRYLNSTEVPDCYCGLYFHDYLPLEGERLLLNDVKHSAILPVQFVMSVVIDEEHERPTLDFALQSLLTQEKYSVQSHVKNSWKLLTGPETYMDNVERMYKDTFVHKGYVMQVCKRFADWLRSQGMNDDADELMTRAAMHDNSKICNKDEFRALTSIINDKSCLGDAKAQLSTFKKDSIELHWKHNAHHPEHFAKPDDMSRLDKIEMVCDWMARAKQYGTDLIGFVETRQEERFHFPELMYDEIMHYCRVLASLYEG